MPSPNPGATARGGRANVLPRLVGLLLLAATLACQSPPDKRLLQYLNTQGFGKRYTGNAEEENYVTLGDSVVWQDLLNKEVRGNARVDIDGTIIVDEVGAVVVAGTTRTEIESLLTEKLAPYYQRTDIRVQIQTQLKTFFVFGEVQKSGAQQFKGDLTVFEAVMDSGPKDHSANLGRVRLIRADPVDPYVATINVNDVLRTGDSTFSGMHVQENDILVVPPTMLAQVGYFLSDLIFPFTEVFKSVFQGLLSVANFNKFGQGKKGFGGGGGGGFGIF
jgi:protein involved in polysaccharide export with SLBB domain